MPKTLTQTILAAFCAVLAALLIVGGGGMSRRRILAAVGSGWVNPYVTDGLVAMWDGEWNVAGGKHNGSSREWIDIVGGLKFSLTDLWAFGDKDAIHTIPQTGYSNITLDGAPSGYDATSATWEVVVDFSGTLGFDERSYLFRNYLSKYVYDGPYFIGDDLTWCKWNNAVQNISAISLKKSNTFTFSNSVGYDGRALYYGNGIYKTSVSGTVIHPIGTIALGNYVGGVAGGRELKWKCLRIYNRALSAEEISSNFSIDKERFGLN